MIRSCKKNTIPLFGPEMEISALGLKNISLEKEQLRQKTTKTAKHGQTKEKKKMEKVRTTKENQLYLSQKLLTKLIRVRNYTCQKRLLTEPNRVRDHTGHKKEYLN